MLNAPNSLTRLLLCSLCASCCWFSLSADESDPLEAALASMEDVLARLDQRREVSADERRQAQEHLSLSHQARSAAVAPSPATVDSSTAAPEAHAAASRGPRAVIDDLLAAAGLREGANGAERGDAYISVAGAVISQPVDHRHFPQARMLALHHAEIQARSAIVRHLTLSVSSERIAQLEAVEGDREAILRSQGIDPDSLDGEAQQRSFEQLIRRRTSEAAAAALVGVSVFAVAEGPSAAGTQEVQVALLWSPALTRLARYLAQGGDTNATTAPIVGLPIDQQIAQDPALLLRSFGVQPMIDEEGRRVLVAYAQAGVEAHSNPSIHAMRRNQALDRARLEAAAMLAEFIHTSSELSAQRDISNLVMTLNDPDHGERSVSQIIEEYRQQLRSASEATAMAGLQPIRRWNGQLHGHEIVGVVVSWSAHSQERSRNMAQELANDGDNNDGHSGDAPVSTPPQPQNEDSSHGPVPAPGSW